VIVFLWTPSAAFALPTVDEPWRSGAAAPADAALLVGIEDYAFLPDVPHARRDLAAVTDLLIHTRGVPAEHVVRLDGGSVEQLQNGLERARAALGAGGRLWVYFSGHGAADPASGALLLVGDDARPDPAVFATRGLPVDALVAGLPAGSVVLLDTCWAGAARTGGALLADTRFAVPTWAAAPPAEVTVWTAAGPGELASGLDPARHGAFTYFVVGALRGWADGEVDGAPDGNVTLDEARSYVTRGLAAAGVASQTPTLAGQARPDALVSGRLEAAPPIEAFAARPAAGVVGGVIAGEPPNPLAALGYRAPLRHVGGSRYADATDRTLDLGLLYGSLGGDLSGEEAQRAYRRALTPTAVGAGLATVGVLELALVSWIPFLQYSKAVNRGLSCDDADAIEYLCIDEQKTLVSGVVLTSSSLALIGTGLGLTLGTKQRRIDAREALVEAAEARLPAE
jgi:hypothetical protein